MPPHFRQEEIIGEVRESCCVSAQAGVGEFENRRLVTI